MAGPLVHAMLTGLPRFGKDTDSLILNLKGAGKVNWFVVLWHLSPEQQPDTMSDLDRKWFDLTESDLRQFIEKRLPPGHNLTVCEWVPYASLEPMPQKYPAFYSNPQNTWSQYSLLKRANQIRLNTEQSLGFTPDVILRGRADGGMDRPLDMEQLALACQKDPHMLVTPVNQRQGQYQFCDHMAIGSDKAITALASVIDHFDRTYREGIPFNAELLIGHILRTQGYYWPPTEWLSTLKKSGYYDSHGIWHQLKGRWEV